MPGRIGAASDLANRVADRIEVKTFSSMIFVYVFYMKLMEGLKILKERVLSKGKGAWNVDLHFYSGQSQPLACAG